MDFETVCKYVGQLYLQSRSEIGQLAEQNRDLKSRLELLQKERDDALRLLHSGQE